MGQRETFSIRQMIELTGLSEFTIRGWENRYHAFSPQRSSTGRREYNKKDIERALLMRELLKRGHKIGKIAFLSNQKLQSLFGLFEVSQQTARPEPKSKAVTEALELMALQKWTELSDLFKNVKHKSASDLIHLFALPLLHELTLQVSSGLVSVAQEHVLSSLLKEKIYFVLSNLKRKGDSNEGPRGIRFVLATPEGDHHEIGLLLAQLLIKSYGYTSLFLGPHTPSQDLSETALRFEASHLLIVSNISRKDGARQHLLNFLSDVQKRMGPELKILIAGSQAPNIPNDQNSKLINVGSFGNFEKYLQILGHVN